MRRSPALAVLVVAGVVLLLDMLVINPALGSVAAALQELVVLLAAAAAIGGTGPTAECTPNRPSLPGRRNSTAAATTESVVASAPANSSSPSRVGE